MKKQSFLRKLRVLKGWTQDDLIAALDCPDMRSRSAVSRIENSGRVKPSIGIKIASFFQIPPHILFPKVFADLSSSIAAAATEFERDFSDSPEAEIAKKLTS